MDYQEVYNIYSELKEILILKKNAIIKKKLDELSKIDEECLVLLEKISKADVQNSAKEFNIQQKDELKKLAQEIKKIEESNEILINHSLNVINNTLSGILNIAQSDKCSYNAKGKTLGDSESINISSITEEA